MPSYGDITYWDQRYTKEPLAFEWCVPPTGTHPWGTHTPPNTQRPPRYQNYHGLKSVLNKHLPKEGRILQVGVGTSRIQEDMARDGYLDITNIDYSEVAVAHMALLHSGFKQLKYLAMDARAMLDFGTSHFDGVLDKGTMDAMLCGERSVDNCYKMLFECHRVLRPSAAYVVVTYGAPDTRMPHLCEVEWGSINVYIIDKLEALDGIIDGSRHPLQVKGPYSGTDLSAMAALSSDEMQGVHFVYVCRKPDAEAEAEQ
jgi:EEF1A lysine methyltransferase 4